MFDTRGGRPKDNSEFLAPTPRHGARRFESVDLDHEIKIGWNELILLHPQPRARLRNIPNGA